MNRRQIIVVCACLAIGVFFFVLPRTTPEGAAKAEASAASVSPEFQNQLEEVKKQTDTKFLARAEYFESRLSALQGAAKLPWYDSLIQAWDLQMRIGIAAEYAVQKATVSDQADDWFQAGKRFLSLARFFEDKDRSDIAARASKYLEKSQSKGNNSEALRTQLGIAYTEAGKDPMKGILMLSKLAEQNPSNKDAQMNLGFFSMRTGQYDKAADRFRKVLEGGEQQPEVRLYLSDALLAQTKSKEALAELQKAITETNDSLLRAAVEERIKNIQKN